jgi:enoyl-CoA hydratase
MRIESTDVLLVEYVGDVVILTLNRPESLNALTDQLGRDLRAALIALAHDDSRVAVITGAGRGFCAGADASGLEDRVTNNGNGAVEGIRGRNFLVPALLEVEQPLIAMVNGPAAGAGATLALFCDIVLMADDARIGDTHVRMGLVSGDGSAVMWPLLLGPKKASEFLLTGRLIDGGEAERLGLVNHTYPQATLRAQTLAMASEIAAQPPFAVKGNKAAIKRYVQWLVGHTLDASYAWEQLSMLTDDHAEAVRAFRERRPGSYHGR